MSKRGPRFTEKEKLAILKEGEKNGVKAVCAKYGVSDQTYRVWRYKTKGIEHKKQFSIKKKREILEQGFQNGIEQVCAAYRISPRTYYRWKKLDFTKSLRRSFTSGPARRRRGRTMAVGAGEQYQSATTTDNPSAYAGEISKGTQA